MKKKLLLISMLLMLMVLTACNKSPVTPTVPTPEKTPEPTGKILSLSEAEEVLINWCEYHEISHMPELDKKDEKVQLYGFLVNYGSTESKWSGETYCYAWVNSSTELINFEEAGYSEETGTNFYANIPDSTFPTPMRDGVIIPYDWFSPPEYVWGVTYAYDDKSVMKTYQAQLKEAGFVDQGTVQSVESLWQYQEDNDGATFTVEMYSEDEQFSMIMYINE